MDFRWKGQRYTYRLIRHPHHPEADLEADIQDLVRRRIPDVGFVVADNVLDAYTNYPIMTVAYEGDRLVAYHGGSVVDIGGRWLINLGSLYLEKGCKRHLGQALMALSALPTLLRRPYWPILFYTLTRSPRVVASGVRWLDCFYPDLKTGEYPPPDILGPIGKELASRGEFLLDGDGLVLGPPTAGWTPIPLPERAWSGQDKVDAYVREALGPRGDRRMLVLGQVDFMEVIKIATRGLKSR